jgi:site-specific DNA-methyltransferase (adenine-specific)
MDSKGTIHQGDTIEFLRSLPDGSAQLIIADPPYNLGKDFGIGKKYKKVSEWLDWSRCWIPECARILAPDGNLFIYGIHHHSCYIQCHLYEIGMVYRRQIIWYYENGWSKYTNGPSCHYEPILWFAHTNDSTYHPIREPYKSTERLKHKITKNGKTWTPHPDGRLAGDVWRFPTLAGRRFRDERTDHPTQKPLALTNRIVTHFSNPGDLVLVPFVGSGTECVSAALNGRGYIGAELNPAYIEIAEKRLQEAAMSSPK